MKQRGSAMVGTMVTLAIICVLLVVFMKGGCGSMLSASDSKRADGKGVTIMGAAEARARDEVCKTNLAQVRQMLMIAESDNDDKPPASLADLHAPDSTLHCPIGHEAYVYDPATGKVKCPHPGHGKY